MTILTGTFTQWSRAGSTKLRQYNHLSPNVAAIRDYLLAKYAGTKNLGGYGVRSIRGGKSMSTHSYGAANDIGFADRGVEREMVEFLVNNSKELGLQAVHTYGSNGLSNAPGIGYIWRSNRSNAGNPSVGWKKQSKKGGMGESWAMWIHFEVHEGVWNDGRPVDARVGELVVGKPKPTVDKSKWPPFDPENGKFGLWPLNTSKPEIRWKDPSVDANEHEATRYLQGVIKKQGSDTKADGDFGPQTNHFVCFYQEKWGLKVDGVVGKKTWPKFDAVA